MYPEYCEQVGTNNLLGKAADFFIISRLCTNLFIQIARLLVICSSLLLLIIACQGFFSNWNKGLKMLSRSWRICR
ncbi:Uncharacterized protein TCM_024083 [Theobroma cacao]|uniref:Uncharacterized protein n=1 Tax=Theobroma cacao TaxID=3641 RepID=A0A061EWN9_THECC|nr:Uncharacterized protein TCM_024083 [Theobroma cacao]